MTFETIFYTWLAFNAVNACIVAVAWLLVARSGRLRRGNPAEVESDRALSAMISLVYLGPVLPVLTVLALVFSPKPNNP